VNDTVDHYEAKQVAANLLHNGVPADTAKYALDIVNGHLKTLARAYLAIADKELRTPGTVEVCARCGSHCRNGRYTATPHVQGECSWIDCPIKQVTNETHSL
jgi:hypothetical protein